MRRWSCRPAQDPATFAITDEAYDGAGTLINSRFLDGMTVPRRRRRSRGGWSARVIAAAGRWPAPGQLPPARLGRLAPARLGLPDPDRPLRDLRRRAGAEGRPAGDAARRRRVRPPRQSARPPSDLEARPLPAVRRRRRRARPTPWTPSWTGPGTSPASPTRGSTTAPTDRKAGRLTGCRSTSTSAASSTRCCTCSTRASSPAP